MHSKKVEIPSDDVPWWHVFYKKFMVYSENSTFVAPSNGTAITKFAAFTPRVDKPVTVQEVQDACKMWDVPMILSLKEAAEIIKIQPSTLKRKASDGYFKGCGSSMGEGRCGPCVRAWSLLWRPASAMVGVLPVPAPARYTVAASMGG
jgi:hypothetical protein